MLSKSLTTKHTAMSIELLVSVRLPSDSSENDRPFLLTDFSHLDGPALLCNGMAGLTPSLVVGGAASGFHWSELTNQL